MPKPGNGGGNGGGGSYGNGDGRGGGGIRATGTRSPYGRGLAQPIPVLLDNKPTDPSKPWIKGRPDFFFSVVSQRKRYRP